MDGLAKLWLALLFVFVFSILTIAAELTYVLCYRSRFLREPPGTDDPEVAAAAATGDPNGGNPSSKELLLYFICLRNQSLNEGALATVTPVYFSAAAPGFRSLPGSTISDLKALPPPPPPPPLAPPLPPETAKLWEVCAPGVLVTIAGGEEVEAGEEAAAVSPVAAAEEQQEEATAAEEGGFEVTPFSTPSGSSRFFYYTPPPSPPPGVEVGCELELSPEYGVSAPGDEEFLSSDGKPPAE